MLNLKINVKSSENVFLASPDSYFDLTQKRIVLKKGRKANLNEFGMQEFIFSPPTFFGLYEKKNFIVFLSPETKRRPYDIGRILNILTY